MLPLPTRLHGDDVKMREFTPGGTTPGGTKSFQPGDDKGKSSEYPMLTSLSTATQAGFTKKWKLGTIICLGTNPFSVPLADSMGQNPPQKPSPRRQFLKANC